MDSYELSVVRSLIGTVTIKHSALVFPNDIGDLESSELAFDKEDVENIEARLLDSKLAERLAVDSLEPNGCAPRDLLHQIPALISAAELMPILRESELTRDGIRDANSAADFPKLHTGNKKIYCLQGQHRIKAAESIPELSDRWWTIRLHCFVDSKLPKLLVNHF
jgi:hypothetical protein